jgi:serine/threonine protein kinase
MLPVEINGRQFDEAAVKVPKEGAKEDLRAEVEGLGQLDHENIVQILGIFYGVPPDSQEKMYLMAEEFCDAELRDIVVKTTLHPEFTQETALELATGIASGMAYIHARGVLHLDLKLENVLLMKTRSGTDGVKYTPKIADFGMTEAVKQIKQHAGTAGMAATKQPWIGTYLYMSPEATGLNAENNYFKGRIESTLDTSEKDGKGGRPLFGASDSFSFGIMLFIMMTRNERWFETDGRVLPTFTN